MWNFVTFISVVALSGRCFAYPSSSSLSTESPSTPLEMMRSYGYHGEEHQLTTSDGYNLTLHRIPYERNSHCSNEYAQTSECQDRPVVFLQHGLFGMSTDFIIAGPQQGLAYILADSGFDVWMGNFRGNNYSRRHETLSPEEDAFWNFCWHQMGTVDLPEMIDYVLEETKQDKVTFIGHSQGTTAFLVMASTRPKYNAKVKGAHLMAPMAFMSHMRSPVMHTIAQITSANRLNDLIGTGEFKPSRDLINQPDQENCESENDGNPKEVCGNALFRISGFDKDQINMSLVQEIVRRYPAGASKHQILHYIQIMKSGRFAQYDHGVEKNLARYSTSNVPVYRLNEVRVPVSLYYGRNDLLVSVEDVAKLKEKLGSNVKNEYVVPNPKWGHTDFVWANDVRRAIYGRVIQNMRQD